MYNKKKHPEKEEYEVITREKDITLVESRLLMKYKKPEPRKKPKSKKPPEWFTVAFGEFKQQLDKRFDAIDKKIDDKIDSLENRMNARFEKVEARLDNIENDINNIVAKNNLKR